MSMNRYVYLMVGIRTTYDELEQHGIDIHEDDDLLPYAEGHEGERLSILYGEGSDYVYIGQVLAKSEPYSEEVSIEITPVSNAGIAYEIQEKIGIPVSNISNWFFDVWL